MKLKHLVNKPWLMAIDPRRYSSSFWSKQASSKCTYSTAIFTCKMLFRYTNGRSLNHIFRCKNGVTSFTNYQRNVRATSLPEQRAFRPTANNQSPTNPLIIKIETRHGEIFKVRNPIRNFRYKWVAILYRAFITFECKNSEMNECGE
jgi:hypothetical protein